MSVNSRHDALILAHNVVVTRTAEQLRRDPSDIDIGKKFVGSAPAGYGFTPNRYLHLCDVIDRDLSLASGRDVAMTLQFCIEHQSSVISDFIVAVAAVVIASPRAPVSEMAHRFANTIRDV